MSSSLSTSSPVADMSGATNALADKLRIAGYHFKAESTRSLSHGERIDVIHGYRISNKSAVVAKVSINSQRLEREYHVIKRLYHKNEGESYLVRPLEFHALSAGLGVAIYTSEAYSQQRQFDDPFSQNLLGQAIDAESKNVVNESKNRRSWIHHERAVKYDRPLEEVKSIPTYDLCTFLRFAIKCTSCLDYIHKFGVVHNEIRLSSFQWDGTDESPVKLWNFGSGAKSFETYLTSEGWRRTAKNKELVDILQNLLVYMSPEQTGRTTYIPDHRTDIYSLGIVFFILLTGRDPYDGGPLDIINGILSRKVALVHELQLDVPEILSRIIEKMTSKAPDDRYSSARGVRHDLNECLKRLNMAGDGPSSELISPFPLAQNDTAFVFALPKRIYGRQDTISHIQFLIENFAMSYGTSARRKSFSFERRNVGDYNKQSDSSPCAGNFDKSDGSAIKQLFVQGNQSTAKIVGLYGPGGIGKSTILSACQATARKHGYLSTAKFDSRNKIPYGTVLGSLSQILQQILAESDDEIKAFYEHLKVSIGEHFQLAYRLADFTPELKPLLGLNYRAENPSTEVIQIDNIEVRARFHKIYVEVFRAITHWRMVTLLLDDLHQADDPSLELLESLIHARVHILILVSYRDQEATSKLSEFLEANLNDISCIKVDALGMDPLIDLICDILHRSRDTDRESVLPLADVVFQKTQGNAFDITQLLRTLERKKLIFFNWEKNKWSYDLQEIQKASIFDRESMSSQLDTSFMISRLRELPRAGQSLLKWASYVGDTFTWETVKNLMISEENDDIRTSRTISSSHSAYSDEERNSISDRTVVESSNAFVQSIHSMHKDDSNNSYDSNTYRSQLHSNKKRPKIHRSNSITSIQTSSTAGSSDDPVSGLHAVLKEGYITSLGGDEFKWSHDRISQAAAELVDPDAHEKIHLAIARYLMKESTTDIFLAADHLLKCQSLLLSLSDKEVFWRTMIEAGSKCQSSGALSAAFSYYLSAIALGNPAEEWDDDHYDITLPLYTNAAALSWVVGMEKKTEQLLNTIFQNSRMSIDRTPAYRIQAQFYYKCQMHENGRESLLRCLDELGDERIRMDTSKAALAREYDQAEKILERLGADGILNLPICNDSVLKGSMGVMDDLIAAFYWSDRRSELFYWACRVVHLSLTKGPTSNVGSSFMAAALGCAHLFKNYKLAQKLGHIGLSLANKHGSAQEKGRAYCMYSAFVMQWHHHSKELLHNLNTALRFSVLAGDRIHTAFDLIWISMIRFFTGHNLADTVKEAEASFEDINLWSPNAVGFIVCTIRTCKALQGYTRTETADVFDGDDGFSDGQFLTESCKNNSNSELILNWYESFKIIPLTLYGHYEAAIATGYRCFCTIDAHPCHRHNGVMLYYFSLALIEKIRHGDTCRPQDYINQVKKNQELLHEWATQIPINYIMYWTLVEAELASVDGTSDFNRIIRLYDDAIHQARQGFWHFDLCVIHEYVGAFYERMGLFNIAHGFIKKAVKLYMRHGSYGKAQHVSKKYSALLYDFDDIKKKTSEASVQTKPFRPRRAITLSNSSSHQESIPATKDMRSNESIPPVSTEQTLITLDILDMASILKSSQVMSSEVKFDSLLTSMMNIILENSGADCGAVIIKDDKYGICAYGSLQESTATFDPPKQLSDDDQLVPSRVVNHTIHTGESIFIHNVEHDTRFAVGPWFERTGAKSVICMPISHKCNIVGCLLIEGTVGVFTQRHVTVLGLLCQQMGISITNAFLFKSVQRVTMANMRMIEMQKQALEDARRSKEAADRATRLREIFLANMSHEIRTPFSGFYGMISLLAETKLDPEQRDLVHTAKESCEMLLRLIDDLLDFSKLQAGKVSLDISPVIVENVIADVVEMLIALAIQKSINITYIVTPEVPSVIMADGNHLRQILFNLLGNAIKFTHHGEIRIRCSMRNGSFKDGVDDSTIPLLFEVIDTGIGITEEQQKALFQPFSQVDGSTTRKYGGTGLGLSICTQLVELMSGTISVDSIPAKGSNFHFTICVTQAVEQSRKHDESIADFLRELSDFSIIVVDKHASTVEMIQSLLPGKSVASACSIEELALHKTHRYSIVIIGFFLANDLNSVSCWVDDIRHLIKKAKGVASMYYPTGSIESGQLTIKSDIMDNTSAAIFGTAQAITRIPIPLRHTTLLEALVDITYRTATSLSTLAPVASSESRKTSQGYITPDERALYKTQNLLVAEDNPVAQKLLYKQLTRLGFNVVCTNNGLEAVEAWKVHPPGYFKMAFFDHHMPKCDGVEATKTIRAAESESCKFERLTIVTLTADIQASACKICMDAGMDDYLTKPMNHKILAETLRRYCYDEQPSSNIK